MFAYPEEAYPVLEDLCGGVQFSVSFSRQLGGDRSALVDQLEQIGGDSVQTAHIRTGRRRTARMGAWGSEPEQNSLTTQSRTED